MKRKTKLISFLLILTLSFGCIIAPYYGQQIYAKALENEFDEEFDQLANSYLTGNDISDEYIDEQTEEITQQYIEYVHFDDNNASKRKLIIDETPIDRKYGAIIYDEETDISEQIENEEDAYNIAVVRMIHKNVDAMNEMVDEELGHINDDYEFVFDVTDESYARFRCYNFKLSWNGVSFNGDSDAAILFGGLALVIRVIFNSVKKDFQNAITELHNKTGALETAINVSLESLQGDTFYQLLSFFTNDTVYNLVNTCSFLIELFTGSVLIKKAIKIVIDHFTPTLLDGIIVLYQALKNYKGIQVKLCWRWSFRDSFGLSIKSI